MGFKENDYQKPIRELVDELEVSFKESRRSSKEPSKVETGVRSAGQNQTLERD